MIFSGSGENFCGMPSFAVRICVGGFAQMSTRRAVRNRSRQRPGSFLEITRLLAQAVPYQIDPSRTISTFGQGQASVCRHLMIC